MAHKHTRSHHPRLEMFHGRGPDERVRMAGRNQQAQLEREAAVLRRIREIRRAGGVVVLEDVLAEFPPDDGETITRLRQRLPR